MIGAMHVLQERKPGVPVSRGELAKLFPANRKASSTMVIKLAQVQHRICRRRHTQNHSR